VPTQKPSTERSKEGVMQFRLKCGHTIPIMPYANFFTVIRETLDCWKCHYNLPKEGK
jgi:hypothetical protein